MDILKGLNQQQTAAVTAEDKHLLVVAGAGSGKTRVLVSRVAWLIGEKRVSPYNIMAVTFTNKAAAEMKERVEAMTGLNTRWMWIGTFHALCARLLRLEAENFGLARDFVIYDDGDTRSLLKRILAELRLADDKKYAPAAVAACISEAKNKLITSAKYEEQAADEWQRNLARVYRAYQVALKNNTALDFDDLLTHSVWYLERTPEVLSRWQERFRHILVDEYQDTNHCQFRLVRLLAGSQGSVFAVGDPDQSIYRWRGADISNILDFSQDFPDCRELPLLQNYRSTQNILDAANALISHNQSRKPKELFTEGEAGESVVLRRTEDDKEEASWVIRQISNLQRDGYYNLGDCAILFRTHGQSRLFEDECIRYGLPYRVFGGQKFYERKEVRDTLAYLRLLASPQDGEALRRIYNEPKRGIGKTSWDKFTALAQEAGLSPGQALGRVEEYDLPLPAKIKLKSLAALLDGLREFAARTQSIRELIRQVWDSTGYAAAIAAAEGAEDKLEILEQLLDAAGDFDLMYEEILSVAAPEETAEAQAAAAGGPEPADAPLQMFLAQVSLATDLDSAGSEGGYLTLMTLHAAKGLEFPVVFIVGLEEGVFPHKRVLFSLDQGEIEEERRLCYVGMTRARQRLYLSAANRRQLWGRYETNKNSRFLSELPPELLQVSGVAEPWQRRENAGGGLGGAAGSGSGSGSSVFSRPPAPEPSRSGAAPALINVGDKLHHAKFGPGVCVAVSGSGDDMTVSVAFPEHGVKKLMWKYAPMKKLGNL